jgi:hypothetical protein
MTPNQRSKATSAKQKNIDVEREKSGYVGFEVFTAVTMRTTAF